MTTDQFDDLLGMPDEIETAPVGREFSLKLDKLFEIQRGVTLQWLVQAFAVPRSVAVKRLAKCPPIKTHRNGAKVYDFRVAVTYMVEPKVSIHEYIQKLDPKQLPPQLKREFWAAKIAEQRWRKDAGQLWSSEDVITVFGEVFKLIKSKTQLWGDSVDTVEALSDVQRETINELVHDLLSQIFKSLEDLESGRATPSQLAEADDDDVEEV